MALAAAIAIAWTDATGAAPKVLPPAAALDELIIPGIGTLKIPEGLETAEIKDLEKYVRESVKKAASDKPDKAGGKIAAPPGKRDGRQEKSLTDQVGLGQFNINGYQFAFEATDAYHLAWMFAFKDSREVSKRLAGFFANRLTDEQKAALVLLQQSMLNQIGNLNLIDPKTGSGMRVLDLDPLEFPLYGGRQAIAGGARALIAAENLKFPLYIQVHAFTIADRLTVIMFVTFDGERTFWDSVFKQIMQGFSPASLPEMPKA